MEHRKFPADFPVGGERAGRRAPTVPPHGEERPAPVRVERRALQGVTDKTDAPRRDVSAAHISRERMVREQLLARGVSDARVLEAMGRVPRHEFVLAGMEHSAYDDRPLPINHGQTISQPYVVARMCELLTARPGMSVLEVGTGSAYQAAVLHAMGLTVFTVERLRPLYLEARDRMARLGLHTIRTLLSDGTMGWPDMAPFDRIIVAAGGPGIPQSLADQLAPSGVMVIPVGSKRGDQRLVRVTRESGGFVTEDCGSTTFVDLVGSQGWRQSDPRA